MTLPESLEVLAFLLGWAALWLIGLTLLALGAGAVLNLIWKRLKWGSAMMWVAWYKKHGCWPIYKRQSCPECGERIQPRVMSRTAELVDAD